MNDPTPIEQARQLIGEQRYDEALQILRELTEAEPTNVEAWLLSAQVLAEPSTKKYCYKKVLEIDPTNETALKGLQALPPDEAEVVFDGQPALDSRGRVPGRVGETDQVLSDVYADAGVATGQGAPRRRRLRWLIPAVLVLLLLVVLALALGSRSGTPPAASPTPPPATAQPQATAPAQPTAATESTAAPEPTAPPPTNAPQPTAVPTSAPTTAPTSPPPTAAPTNSGALRPGDTVISTATPATRPGVLRPGG